MTTSESLIDRELQMRRCAVAACQQWWATTAPTAWVTGRICPGCIAGPRRQLEAGAAA